MRFLKLLPILLTLAFGDHNSTSRVDVVYATKQMVVGDSGALPGIGLDVGTRATTGPDQAGIYLEPIYSPAGHGIDGIRIRPHIRGHVPYATLITLLPPVLDSGASVDHLVGIEVMDMFGGDSSNHSLVTHRGAILGGDTASWARLVRHGGGIEVHGSLLTVNRQLSDTDYILVGYNSGRSLHDTLPLLSLGPGLEYWMVQYAVAADSNWVIYPHAGEKIDGYDSIVLKSNLGKSWLHIVGLGNTWKILGRYEEGAWLANLNNITDTAKDTAWYYMRDVHHFHIQVKKLVGNGTLLAAANFTVSGLDSRFTNTTLDTTRTCTSIAVGEDNTAFASLVCILPLNGAGSAFRCSRTDFGVLNALGGKRGLAYGVNFECDMGPGKQAGY